MPAALSRFDDPHLRAHLPVASLHPEINSSRPRFALVVPATGGALLALLGLLAYLSVPTPPKVDRARQLATPEQTSPAPAVLQTTACTGSCLEEKLLVRADEPGTVAVHPNGEVRFVCSGSELETRVLNGEWSVQSAGDGSWQVRPLHPEVRGEVALWCGRELYTVRLRTDPVAPLQRKLWVSPPADTTPVQTQGITRVPAPTDDVSARDEAATRAMLDVLVQLEARGVGGEGAGEYGTGQQDGISTHWRRSVRRGEVCGAVVDLTGTSADPYFFEPSSLSIDLPGRGCPEVLARSSAGMVLPGKTVPALVIWRDPLPPGPPASTVGTETPCAGPYALHFHPWALPWKDLAYLSKPAPAATVPKPRRR